MLSDIISDDAGDKDFGKLISDVMDFQNETNNSDDSASYAGSPQPEITELASVPYDYDIKEYIGRSYNPNNNSNAFTQQGVLEEFELENITPLRLPGMFLNELKDGNMNQSTFYSNSNGVHWLSNKVGEKTFDNCFLQRAPRPIDMHTFNATERTFQPAYFENKNSYGSKFNVLIGSQPVKAETDNTLRHVKSEMSGVKRSCPAGKKASYTQRPNKYKHKNPRAKPNNCYHLWDFLDDLLHQRVYSEEVCVEWTNEENKEFRITDTKQLAYLWGNKKNSKSMTYDKLSRTIRYYCTLDILKKIDGKRLQFKFSNGKMWTRSAS